MPGTDYLGFGERGFSGLKGIACDVQARDARGGKEEGQRIQDERPLIVEQHDGGSSGEGADGDGGPLRGLGE